MRNLRSIVATSARPPVYAIALICVMILRPQGLFGIKELWDLSVWRRHVLPLWQRIFGGPEVHLPAAIVRPEKEEDK